MKRWLFALMTIALSFSINNIFATEQLDIYDEPEYVNEGTVVINFLSKIREDAEEEINNPIVEGVEIELYYRYNGEMINVKELPQFQDKNLNLVSDSSGKITLDDFPYGFYQYYIVSVPFGYKLNTEVRTLDLNILNSTINRYDFIVEDIHLAEGGNVIEEEPKVEENEEVKLEENIENVQETTNENVSQVNNNININININLSINTILNDSYNKTQKEQDDDNIFNERITNNIKVTNKKIKLDILDAMKDIKINDTIKVAILDNNKDVYKIHNNVVDLPVDNKSKKHKKIVTIERFAIKSENINYVNRIHFSVKRQIMS